MQTHEVIIVGGGPAGSSAAQRLVQGGADVLVLDRDAFPRLKLCAGWITPEVASDLGIDRSSYPHRWLTFERLNVYLGGLRLRVRSVQHSIRRVEFDAWLLERSGAQVERHTVRQISREGDAYVIDGRYRCRYLVGAGGTSCPVYRTFFREANPRVRELQMVTLEHELPYDWVDPDCHLWFFERGLPGYAWYVPKENGWLNVGIGGAAARINRGQASIKEHWERFVAKLGRRLVSDADWNPAGHTYYMRGPLEVVRTGDAFIVGDSAGLATRDLGEGIGPAVRSGQRAADSILHGAPYVIDDVTGASAGGGLMSRALEWGFTRGAAKDAPPGARRAVPAA